MSKKNFKIPKHQLKVIRERWGSNISFTSTLIFHGVEEDLAYHLHDCFVTEHGYRTLEMMSSKDFRDLLTGYILGVKDAEAIKKEFVLN